MGGKTDNKVVSGATVRKQTGESDVRLQHAYAYFLLHLKEIAACVEGGCSVKSVWRSYATRTPEPFPGSYSSFLRYCTDHGLAPRRANAGTDTAANRRGLASPAERPDRTPPKTGALRGPKPVGSVLGRLNMFPPPLERPPGFIPSEEE